MTVWCLVAGLFGIVVHAHDTLFARAAGIQPESGGERFMAFAGFATKSFLAAVVGGLLWLGWTNPDVKLFAFGGIGVAVLVWSLEVAVTRMWQRVAGPYDTRWWVPGILLIRQLITYVTRGILVGLGVWFFFN